MKEEGKEGGREMWVGWECSPLAWQASDGLDLI